MTSEVMPAGMTRDVIDARTRRSHDAGSEAIMRTYQLQTLGDPAGIIETNREPPTPGRHDIVVRVRATSLNKRDLFILKGMYPMPARPGVVPVSDGAGEVVAVGDQVTRFRIGDRVAGN